VIQRIFEWAADGVGLTSIVERLNPKAFPAPEANRATHPLTDK
jgi:hypothetical protein